MLRKNSKSLKCVHQRTVNLDNFMFNYSQLLLWCSVYSWIRVALVTKIRSVRGTKQPSTPNREIAAETL